MKTAKMATYVRQIVCSRGNLSNSVVFSFFSRNSATSNDKSWEPQEKVTHTGQEWSKDDYRLVRFIDKPKQINEKFAIDLIANTPPIAVEDNHTWCDGGGGPLGHPKVYINLDPKENHSCGYCGLRFFQKHH